MNGITKRLVKALLPAIILLGLCNQTWSAISITDLEQVQRDRVSRTVFEYRFRVHATNPDQYRRMVVADATSTNPAFQVVNATVEFGDIAQAATATSTNTLILRINRRTPFNPADINFVFSEYDPIYLTEGGNLAPKTEPEFGETGYLDTYYGKVDPTGERATLAGWRTVNGFDSFPGAVARARYVNAYDLGFGRDMRCLDAPNLPCYVENYLDPTAPHGGTFAATVAMERQNKFSRTFIAFFVYDPAGNRINAIALDSEGPKSVPESCYACHSGYTSAGGNPVGGVYLPWDLGILENWPGQPTINSQAEEFRRLNRSVWRDAGVMYSRAIFTDPLDPTTFVGNEITERKESVKDLIEKWYEGPPFFGTTFNYATADLAPDSWYTPGGDFFRERFLYKNIYAPFCRSCHVAQGPNQNVNADSHGLDWATAGSFAVQSYAAVCGGSPSAPRMPHAELTDDRFRTDLINFTNGTSATAFERLCAEEPDPGANAFAILTTNCSSCHRPGGMMPTPNLSSQASIEALGPPYIVSGNAAASRIYQRMTDAGSPMPTAGSGGLLDSDVSDLVRDYINGL